MENIRLKMDRVDYWEKHHMLPPVGYFQDWRDNNHAEASF